MANLFPPTAVYLRVKAPPRYWEDATVNGVKDQDGSLIPFRHGDQWCPVIHLASGQLAGWPRGTSASVYYKVCDEGEYFLSDKNGALICKYRDAYVPDSLLCHGLDLYGDRQRGFGDYIILEIGETGLINGYTQPSFYDDDWDWKWQ